MKTDFNLMTKDVFEFTSKLIEKFGPRLAGSSSSIGCADDLHIELDKFCDSTDRQEFKVHSGAFLGWIKILVVLYVLSVFLLLLNMPWIASGVLFVGIIIMVFQFFLYKHMIDFLYPAKTGVNVMGVLEPEGEVEKQIIISGHHDSARVFNFFIHQPKLYSLRVIGGIGILCIVFVTSLIFAILSAPTMFVYVLGLVASLGMSIVVQLWFFAGKNGTPGAGDNLISSVIAVESLREFASLKKSGEGLKNTRVIAVSFDAEEEGLRGAHAYAKKNEQMLKSVPTYQYNIDCPYLLKDIFFLTSDINTSVKLSQDFADRCVESSRKIGYESKTQLIEFLTGGTDAGELAKVGVLATTLMAMPWDNSDRASVYHTPMDTIDAVDENVVRASMEIFMDVVKTLDDE